MEKVGAVKLDLTHLQCESTELAHRGARAELNSPNPRAPFIPDDSPDSTSHVKLTLQLQCDM